jgi:hypothetical protein
MATYWELLKHPKWQEARLRVLGRCGFKCEHCGSGEHTLHVHHAYYRKGAKPWEYPADALMALCESCHARMHQKRADLDHLLAILSRDPTKMERLEGYAQALCFSVVHDRNPSAVPDTVVAETYYEAQGVADFYRIDTLTVLDAAAATAAHPKFGAMTVVEEGRA